MQLITSDILHHKTDFIFNNRSSRRCTTSGHRIAYRRERRQNSPQDEREDAREVSPSASRARNPHHCSTLLDSSRLASGTLEESLRIRGQGLGCHFPSQ